MTKGARLVALTYSEARVVRELMLDGARNPIIAKRLFITEDTVKSHMKAILRKTGCADRTKLVMALLRQQIILTQPLVPSKHGYEAMIFR